jgi:hypothetical protein
LAAIRSGHTLAEAMHAHAAADLGLVRSFRHRISSFNADNKSKPFNDLSGTTLYRKVFF